MASDGYLLGPPRSARQRNYQTLILIATGGVGLLMLMVISSGLLQEAAILLVGAIGAVAVWRYPQLAAAFLIAFTPVNRFVIFVAFNFASSPTILHGMQLWKDGIIAILLIRVLHEALERRTAPRVHMMDILAAMFLLLNLMYVLYPGTLEDNDLVGRMLGFRLDAYFVFAYFVGRGLTLEKRHVKWILLGIIPGSIAVGLVAAWQWAFPGWANEVWARLGYQAFVDAVNGSSDIAVRTRDLGGLAIPRASSLLMGDLALAFYQLLLVPIAAAFLLAQRKSTLLWQVAAAVFLALMLATMAFSGARSAMVAIPIALVVIALWSKSYGLAITGGVLMLPLMAAFLIVFSSGQTGEFFDGLISPNEGSTVAHGNALERSVNLIEDEPLGRGLGTSHTVGFQRGIRESFANESWFLQLGSETGILGMLFYTFMMVGATVTPLLAYNRVKDPWLRALTLGSGGAAVGFLLVGLVLHVWEVPVIAAVFWLLVGIAVRAPQLEEQWKAKEAGES